MVERIEENRIPLVLAAGLGGLIALSLALRPAPQVGLASLAVGVAVLALINRRVVLYLIVPAIALSPDIPILGVPVRIEDLLMVPLVAGWLAHLCVFKNRQRTPLDRLLIAYFIVGLAAAAWGGYLGTAHFTLSSKDYSAPFHLLKRLEFLFLFFIVSDTFITPREVRALTYVLIASMIGLSAFQLLHFLSIIPAAMGPADPGHEPGLASLLNVALALALFPAATRSAKLVLGAVILFSVGVLPLSEGRNYIATTGLMILYVGLFQQRWVLMFLPVAWLLTFLYPAHVLQRVLTLEHVFTPDVSGTLYEGASLISRAGAPVHFGLIALGYSPVLGFGLASLSLGHFDSEYATQLFYTGLVGLAVFFMLAARLFHLTRDTVRAARDPLDARLARGFHLIWIAYAVHSIFSPSISASRVGAVFFILAGLLVVLHRSVTGQRLAPRGPAQLG